jgi:hypothetical protein
MPYTDIYKERNGIGEESVETTGAGGPKDPGLESGAGGPLGKATKLSPFDGKLSPREIAGLDNTNISEKQPHYVKAECEKVVKGDNNTHIILGRDRHSGISSGYGGKGHTRAGAIDIVVGLQGFAPAEGGRQTVTGWRNGKADKNFGSMNNAQPGDAARIYISQRANIDDYFDIADGYVGKSIADSAIAMRADSIRILANKGIKLVTGKNPPGRNSLDGKIKVTYGIDLIAGNRDFPSGLEQKLAKYGFLKKQRQYLQPIPKGDNLVDYLMALQDDVESLNARNQQQMITMVYMMIATLMGTMPVTGMSLGFNHILLAVNQLIKQYADAMVQTSKLITQQGDYLEDAGAYYINSPHNRTN